MRSCLPPPSLFQRPFGFGRFLFILRLGRHFSIPRHSLLSSWCPAGGPRLVLRCPSRRLTEIRTLCIAFALRGHASALCTPTLLPTVSALRCCSPPIGLLSAAVLPAAALVLLAVAPRQVLLLWLRNTAPYARDILFPFIPGALWASLLWNRAASRRPGSVPRACRASLRRPFYFTRPGVHSHRPPRGVCGLFLQLGPPFLFTFFSFTIFPVRPQPPPRPFLSCPSAFGLGFPPSG